MTQLLFVRSAMEHLALVLLQRDAIVGHAEAIRTQSRKPSKAHTQETPAYQRRPTTQYAAQGSNPPIGQHFLRFIPNTILSVPRRRFEAPTCRINHTRMDSSTVYN